MPARQPFTALCRSLARPAAAGRADLHIHTTHSDGNYTPAQVIDLARRSGLSAVAITDHDTLAGFAEARAAAEGTPVEVIPAAEITCEYGGKDLHLLAYFVRPDDPDLGSALGRLRADRLERFWQLAGRLRERGVSLEEGDLRALAAKGSSVGRRHLAELIVRAGKAGTIREAFRRYLSGQGRVMVPRLRRLPVAEGLALVRGAGGVAGWAHPSYDCTREALLDLRGLGLGAVEVEYPARRPARKRELRGWAQALGLAVTGGSDCHGPEPLSRTVGASGVSAEELEVLRTMAAR
jgi:predicted metal-dependent phosphoesterase TrpH